MIPFITAVQSKIQNLMRSFQAARAPGQPLADPEDGITTSTTEPSSSTNISPPDLRHFLPGLHPSNFIILERMGRSHDTLTRLLRSRVASFATTRRDIGECWCPLPTKLANILRTLADFLTGRRWAEAHNGDIESGPIARLARGRIPPSFRWVLAAAIMMLIAAVSQKFATTYMTRLPALVQPLFDMARRISLARPLFPPLSFPALAFSSFTDK